MIRLPKHTRSLKTFSTLPTLSPGSSAYSNNFYSIVISTVFRRLGSSAVRGKDDIGVMDLFETDLGDVEMARDALFPIPKDGSKGVRVKLSK
jgi:hypothetical protein